jgi:hypothetical protein
MWVVESGRKPNRILNNWLVWTSAGAQRRRAYEALPQTPPGGKPPETPGPLSLDLDYTERAEVVKGSQAAPKAGAPLTTSTRSEDGALIRGKGGKKTRGQKLCGASRWSAPKSGSKLESGEVYLTSTGLLMEGAETLRRTRRRA